MILGCFNRPWSGCELERVFAGIAAAGFRHCGLMRHNRQAILSATMPPEAVATLLDQVRRYDLQIQCNLVSLQLNEPFATAVARLKEEIDQAQAAHIPHLLTGGTPDPARYEAFYAVAAAAAPYAAERGVTLGLKPHGGISATNRDCVTVAQRIGKRGFGIWYDPGNIIHYTGTSPEADLEAVAPFLVGMCVKDCAGGLRGSVSITPGDGEVNFPRIFAMLRQSGFQGPALVECLGGTTPDEVDAQARRVHDSLRRWIGA
jgi:sugar phosphate isomerase/epimerase